MAASEGVDLEWAIVELARIEMNKQKAPTRPYSKKILVQANLCLKHLYTSLGKTFDIYHSDETIPGIGKGISAKPEPKTDIVVIKTGTKYFISVKMAGGIQLASGQGSSTAELFQAAAKQSNVQNTRVFRSIVDELNRLPTRLLSESNLPRIKEEGNQKVIKEFLKAGKIIQDKSYEHWLKNNKPVLLNALLDFVKKDDAFYTELIRESMTGKITLQTFRGAAATHIISPSGFHKIDNTYIQKIKKKIKMDIRAKSRGGISAIAFRIETTGT